MAQQNHRWGVTDSISTNFPTEQELALNDSLIAELRAQNTFEATEETNRRYAFSDPLECPDR